MTADILMGTGEFCILTLMESRGYPEIQQARPAKLPQMRSYLKAASVSGETRPVQYWSSVFIGVVELLK
jgi:hypothetical protein